MRELTDHYVHAPPVKDIAALLSLANELHLVSPNPIVRHGRMLDALCGWTGASLAVSVLIARNDNATPHVLTMIYAARWPTQSRLVTRAADHEANEMFRDGRVINAILRGDPSPLTRSALGVLLHVNEPLVSVLPSSVHARHEDGSVMSIASGMILFNGQHVRAFDARSRRMVSLVHSQADWMYRAPAPGDSAVGMKRRTPLHLSISGIPTLRDREPALSTRQQQTLRQLLSGESEKQIAVHMAISRHTVHEHVKAIYRAVGVPSRPELMARFLQRARMAEFAATRSS